MGCFEMYCCLCGCSFGYGLFGEHETKVDSRWRKDIVNLMEQQPNNSQYYYDSYGRMINDDTKEKYEISHVRPKYVTSCNGNTSFMFVHRSCWIVCDRPKFNDIKACISVPEFNTFNPLKNRYINVCGQVFAPQYLLDDKPELIWMFQDPLENKDNYNRIRFEFYKNKYIVNPITYKDILEYKLNNMLD